MQLNIGCIIKKLITRVFFLKNYLEKIVRSDTKQDNYESKNNLIKALKKIKKQTDKIIIVITHDFFILPIFDSVVLMENGKMIKQSTHDKLININAWYAEGYSTSTN